MTWCLVWLKVWRLVLLDSLISIETDRDNGTDGHTYRWAYL